MQHEARNLLQCPGLTQCKEDSPQVACVHVLLLIKHAFFSFACLGHVYKEEVWTHEESL